MNILQNVIHTKHTMNFPLPIIITCVTIAILSCMSIYLFLASNKMDKMERATADTIKPPQIISSFPTIYTIMINGMYSRSSSVPGDVTATMAVYKGVKDSDRFRDDVKNRIITHVIIKKHPYEIRFFKQLMDKI
jgi:hypothetical protein